MERHAQLAALGLEADLVDEGVQHLAALFGHERVPHVFEAVEQLGHVLAIGLERRAGTQASLDVGQLRALLVGLALEVTKATGDELPPGVGGLKRAEEPLGPPRSAP